MKKYTIKLNAMVIACEFLCLASVKKYQDAGFTVIPCK